MEFKKENRHVVDVLFVITLFCVFAFCALMLVILGAEVYKKTVASMESNYTTRTSYAYISEKIRQKDTSGAVKIAKFGDADAIFLEEKIGEKSYFTVLYVDDGYLKELFTADPERLGAGAGTQIYECESLSAEKVSDSLVRIEVTTPVSTEEIYAAVKSDGGMIG